MSGKLAIIGGDSQIGNALRQYAQGQGAEVLSTSRRRPASHAEDIFLDLACLDSPPAMLESCDAAVLCAGISQVRYCESHRAETRHINLEQTRKLIQYLLQRNCFVVFLSSNMVFDGECPRPGPLDAQRPVTEYGFQKASLEKTLLATPGEWAIVRMTKVVAGQWPILDQWREALRSDRVIHPFTDYVCSLVSLEQVCVCLTHIACGRRRGVWHVSAPDEVSYAEIAAHYAGLRGLNHDLIAPVDARSAGFDQPLPRHAALDASLTEKELNLTFPSSLTVLQQVTDHDSMSTERR